MKFTHIRAIKPPELTKRFWLEDGTLRSSAAAQMLAGVATRCEVTGLDGFAEFIANQRGVDWAICAGVSKHRQARIVTKKRLATAKRGALPVIARSKRHLRFLEAPGLFAMDYDPKDSPMTAAEFCEALRSACPWLADAGLLITPSTTGRIFDASTGAELKGRGGLHGYMIAPDARHIPELTNTIFQALFPEFGYAAVTKSGAVHPRTLIDRCLSQPERLIFECGASLSAELVQRRDAALYVPGAAMPAHIPHRASYNLWRHTDALWLARKVAAEPEAAHMRELWIAERLASGKISRASLERVLNQRVLTNAFRIELPSGKQVSVGYIRRNMARYEGLEIPDPLEPDFEDGKLCAVIFPWGIYSQAYSGYALRFGGPAPLNFNLPLAELNFDN